MFQIKDFKYSFQVVEFSEKLIKKGYKCLALGFEIKKDLTFPNVDLETDIDIYYFHPIDNQQSIRIYYHHSKDISEDVWNWLALVMLFNATKQNDKVWLHGGVAGWECIFYEINIKNTQDYIKKYG